MSNQNEKKADKLGTWRKSVGLSKKPSYNDVMADNTAAELKEKLEEEIHTAEWNDIRPHALRDAVVLVAPGLSLIEASIKVVQDDVDTVKDWLDRKSIEKVTPQHIETWDQTKNKVFSMVILDPYVFIQAQQH